MANLNVYLDENFEKMFKELKLILNVTNREVVEKIINIAYKNLKNKEG